jgi:hypothetical protein
MTDNAPIVIETTAPIPVSDLKRKFTEVVEFHIDVDSSRLKGTGLITYLSNLNIAARLKFTDPVVMQELMVAYFHSTVLVTVKDLEDLAIHVILAATGKPHTLPFDPVPFIAANFEIVETWIKRLDSIPLYALYCRPDLRAEVASYPEDEDKGMHGINFVKLMGHDLFEAVCFGIEEGDYNWNKMFFEEYCFAGANLFTFFANRNNPYFMAILLLDDHETLNKIIGQVTHFSEEIVQTMKEIAHVPPTE